MLPGILDKKTASGLIDSLVPDVSLHLQSLASAIAATKVLSAQQVVKNEAGEEVSEYYVHWWKKN